MTPGGLPSALGPESSSIDRIARELLDEAEDLEVVVVETRSGRASGWRVSCSSEEHGTFPIELRKKARAVKIAKTHIVREHAGKGRVRIRRSR